jgi:hypothetical protein
MKKLATYCLLIAWCGYFILSTGSPALATKKAEKHLTCHLPEENKKQDDCCSRLHQENKEPIQNHSNDDENDCCGNTDCTRTCCHISLIVLPAAESIPVPEIIFISEFTGMNKDLLPNPFIGIISPPPNV